MVTLGKFSSDTDESYPSICSSILIDHGGHLKHDIDVLIETKNSNVQDLRQKLLDLSKNFASVALKFYYVKACAEIPSREVVMTEL